LKIFSPFLSVITPFKDCPNTFELAETLLPELALFNATAPKATFAVNDRTLPIPLLSLFPTLYGYIVVY